MPLCAFCWLCLTAGCATDRAGFDKHFLAGTPPDHQDLQVAESYLVAFPDVLDIQVMGRPDVSGQCAVGLDGRIELGLQQRLRVEGQTIPQIGRLVANQAGVAADVVRVSVLEYRSRPLFLQGQVAGWQRTIPYHGQETVLEVLQRVGGITPGASPEEVYVVRAHVADGQKPEIFHVDLKAIVIKGEERTNIRVLPYDQIHVGQSRQAKILKCVPPWLKPVFVALWGPRQSRPDARSLHLRRASAALGAAEPEEAEPPFIDSPATDPGQHPQK